MEVFKVFATMSLMDMISGPLGSISEKMKLLGQGVDSLGGRMGKLAVAMAPVALAAALVLGGLTLIATSGLATEKALGELATLGVKDFAAMEKAATNASNTMAGITKDTFITAAYDIKSGISSLSDSGVAAFTELAAVTSQATKSTIADMTNLGATAYGVFKKMYADMSDQNFGTMLYAGVASSVQLFKTTGSAMNQAMSNAGAAATNANRPLEEQLAILGTLQNTMEASVAGTAYKNFFRDASKGFGDLGIKATDATGQMRSMPDLLADLEAKLGPLNQMKLDKITKAFGAETGAMIQNLLGKSGELKASIDSVGSAMKDGRGFLDNMASSMNMGLGPALAILKQRTQNLAEEFGKHLSPALTVVVLAISDFALRMQDAAKNPIVGFLLKLVGGISAAVIAATALSGAIWLVTAAVPMLTAALTPLATAVMAITWPVWLVIGAVAALYLAYKTNFGGMADTLDRWWSKISLVGRGVMAVFATLTGGVGEIKGQLAKDIEAAGLTGLVTTVGRIVNRFRLLFTSFWEALAPLGEKLGGLFGPVFSALGQALAALLKPFALLIGLISGKAADTGASNWATLGKVLGTIVYVAAMVVAFALRMLLAPVQILGMVLPWLVDKFLWLAGVISDLPGLIADAVHGALTSVVEAISGFSLYDAGASLLGTFADGILSMLSAPADAVRQALDWVGRLLPHSDAEEGPLSTLTASGMATLNTMGLGMQAAAPDLRRTLDDALGQAVPALEASAEVSLNSPRKAGGEGSGGRTIHINIASLALPGVTDAQGFLGEIQRYVEQHDA